MKNNVLNSILTLLIFAMAICALISLSSIKDNVEAPDEEPHEHIYDAETLDATCTSQGYTTYKCSCGYSYVGDYVEPTGHDLVSSGTDKQTCDHCGNVFYRFGVVVERCKYYHQGPTTAYEDYVATLNDSIPEFVMAGDVVTFSITENKYTINGNNTDYAYFGLTDSVKINCFVASKDFTSDEDGQGTYTYSVAVSKDVNGPVTIAFKNFDVDDNTAPHICHTVIKEIVQPTCTEDGYLRKWCCCYQTYEDVYNDTEYTLRSTGHSFVGGRCNKCEAYKVNVTVPVVTATTVGGVLDQGEIAGVVGDSSAKLNSTASINVQAYKYKKSSGEIAFFELYLAGFENCNCKLTYSDNGIYILEVSDVTGPVNIVLGHKAEGTESTEETTYDIDVVIANMYYHNYDANVSASGPVGEVITDVRSVSSTVDSVEIELQSYKMSSSSGSYGYSYLDLYVKSATNCNCELTSYEDGKYILTLTEINGDVQIIIGG